MKKFIFTALTLGGLASLNAQTATLNVRLKPIQTLVVNTAQKTVNLDYNTKQDYADGVTSQNADHLTVYSTGGFQVKVKSGNSALQNGSKSIQANTIQVKASAGTNPVNGAQYSPFSALGAETTLVTSATGGVDRTISVDYKGASQNTYLDNYVAGQNVSVYTVELTYTITPQ
ncbi:hypothetical protein [Chryseobacterium hagamense]|uniref:Peptidoglycan-binding protein LysM n=1 Tax=Chryseobacterium hagamense TaxID=395935 RepID=A0A511YGK8_9FLAO|nr:hypothetical protein [Chryseobacterium hagamense]GEN74325.1 hypothetical protein CHA01nite_00650 [Chryseobacterium hagamense]